MAYRSDFDPYVDAGSGILRNLPGILNPQTLDAFEGEMFVIRQMELSANPVAGTFDLAHLRAIHRHLFQDVYRWAGEVRTVDISKGMSQFGNHLFIESYASSVFAKLAKERPTWNPSVINLPERLSEYLGEINALHPFREGNGRTQRIFIGQLAACHGLVIRWDEMKPGEMLDASIASFVGNNQPLRDLIARHCESVEPGILPACRAF